MLILRDYKELSLKVERCLIDKSKSGDKRKLEVMYAQAKDRRYVWRGEI